MLQVLLLTFVSLFLSTVQADMYLQSVRGSNNRLDEANRERNNANRLFDSQNNDRGGYNVGKLNYYVTEKVPISWTNQHGCGTEDVKHCEVVLQALCDPLARDGTTTQRIPTNNANCRNFDCDTDVKYGRHESYDYYKLCEQTKRNEGLFLASQQPNRGDATRTRQNPGGTRRGYECPEERDYYPYWRSSPWVDLAIWTKDINKCNALAAESENVKSRWYCDVPQSVRNVNNFGENAIAKIPITQAECEELNDAVEEAAANAAAAGTNSTTARATWTEIQPNGFPAPECLESRPTRPNHLGLVGGETQWTYEWTVPEALLADGADEKACTFRVRYNITEDYDASARDGVTAEAGMIRGEANPDNTAFTTLDNAVTAAHSRKKNGGGNANNRPSKLQVWRKYGITDDEVNYDAAANNGEGDVANTNDGNNGQGLGDNRDYLLRNNPKPDVLGKTYGNNDYRVRLQLAVNTAQYGRTFQDRTHMTYVMKRPAEIGNAEIKLVTVAGKRGNIVQTFPGTEYFFIPETLHVPQYAAVHFSWSGSNTNPNNNDGQGKQGTDRSNVCPMNGAIYDPDATLSRQGGDGLKTGANQIGSAGTNYPAYVKEPTNYARAEAFSSCSKPEQVQPPIAGFDLEVAEALCTGRREVGSSNDFGNMEELDDAGASFNLPPQIAKQTGCWNYVSTRNNNFSNRSQKGTLCVDKGDFATGDVGPKGDSITSQTGWVAIPPGAVTNIVSFSMISEPQKGAASEQVWIEPVDMKLANTDSSVEFALRYEQRALYSPVLKHRVDDGETWQEMTSASYKSSTDANGRTSTVAMANINEGGAYVVEDKINVGALVAIIFAALVFIGAVGFIVWWKFFKSPPPSDEYAVNTGTYA